MLPALAKRELCNQAYVARPSDTSKRGRTPRRSRLKSETIHTMIFPANNETVHPSTVLMVAPSERASDLALVLITILVLFTLMCSSAIPCRHAWTTRRNVGHGWMGLQPSPELLEDWVVIVTAPVGDKPESSRPVAVAHFAEDDARPRWKAGGFAG